MNISSPPVRQASSPETPCLDQHRDLSSAVGLGLKPAHYTNVLDEQDPAGHPAWLEVHPQNYFGDGGPPHRWLTAIAEVYPLSFHSVGLSLGSVGGVHSEELDRLAALCERYRPARVSDHLSWSGSAHDRLPDLLPIPYTREALDHFVAETGRVQDRLKRPILLENPSRYLAYTADEMGETDFIHTLCRRAGCGLLLDINNVVVSCTNLNLSAGDYVDAVDPAIVGEVHLAGHAREDHADGPMLIDDHGSRITDATWQLYRRFIQRAGPKPTLVEWDTDIPAYAVLMQEADKATVMLQQLRAPAYA